MADNVIRRDVVQIGWEVEKSPLSEMAREANALKNSLGGISDSGLNEVAKTAQDSASSVSKLQANINRADQVLAKVKETASKLAHPFKTVTSAVKSFANTKISNLKNGIQQTVKTLTEGQSGAKGFGNAIKNLAKASLGKLVSGAQNAKSAFSGIAKTSFNALKNAISKMASGLKNIASHALQAAASLAKMTGKALVAGVGAMVAGITALGTASIKGYAEYEQLKGGVETLFGTGGQSLEDYANSVGKTVQEVRGEYGSLMKAQNDVMKNAQNAYKDAGLSANAYMETVTGFSASLIQSMGGDTEAAAAKAHTAIVDMADNANKMGTDMESIQNAYQGFAKQNYTMLDNLKLGYGGTQEEMVRLINDSGVLNKKIESMDGIGFDTIVDAIHVVQENLGVAGATADEAASTIQGSANAMKAAWENFLTGMADPDQDFDVLVGNLIDSVVTFGDNLIPRIQIMLPRLVEGLAKLAESAADELPGILTSVLPTLVNAGISLMNSLVALLRNNTQQFSTLAIDIVMKLATFLLQSLPDIIVVGIELITALIVGIAQQIPQLIPLAIQAIFTIANSLMQNLPIILNAGIQILFALIQGLIQMLPQLIPMGVQLIVQLTLGLIQAIPQLLGMIPTIFVAFVEGLMAVDWLTVGKDILSALGNGILTGVKELGGGIWEGVKSIFKGDGGGADAKATGVETMNSYSSGLTSGTPSVMSATDSITETLSTNLTTDLTDIGTSTMSTYNVAITDGGIEANTIAQTTNEDLQNTFNSLDLKDSGKNVMKGLISGMNSMRSEVISTAQSIANAVKNTINDALDIHSPSGVAEWQMKMYGAGIVRGADKTMPAVQAASNGISEAIYKPETRQATSRTVNNSYAPSFTLNVTGTVDRTTERTIKQWVQEAMEDMFDSMSRTNPRLTEV